MDHCTDGPNSAKAYLGRAITLTFPSGPLVESLLLSPLRSPNLFPPELTDTTLGHASLSLSNPRHEPKGCLGGTWWNAEGDTAAQSRLIAGPEKSSWAQNVCRRLPHHYRTRVCGGVVHAEVFSSARPKWSVLAATELTQTVLFCSMCSCTAHSSKHRAEPPHGQRPSSGARPY